MDTGFQGVVTPLLTPFAHDGAVAADLYAAHARRMLEAGSHYLSPFGTTGEATSLTAVERRRALEGLVGSGTAPDRLMPGTGLCALGDTVELTRHAVELGCAVVMVLPPFFYPADDEGLYAYFAALIERVASDRLRICLYHIPQNTGVGISPALAARLNGAFPAQVVAYKDSSGDWQNTRAVIDAAPGLAVFPSSEVLLPEALPVGAAGCISATCNVNVARIRRLYDAVRAGDREAVAALMPQVARVRQAFERAGLIRALKSQRAHEDGDARWLNTRPPLRPADPTPCIELEAERAR
jgi:4-hydroxy-tetrahydrodipicolinate synthase